MINIIEHFGFSKLFENPKRLKLGIRYFVISHKYKHNLKNMVID